MFVEEFSGSKGTKYFRYKIGDKEHEDVAGAVLCELLNSEISCFLYDYQCYLHSGEIKFKKRVEDRYSAFSPILQDVLKVIFPMNSRNVVILEKLDDLVRLSRSKIAANDASYNFFLFALTNFYEYTPPIFPIQKYKVSFLNFICPLVEKYIPFKIYTADYQELIKEINEINNVTRLETLLWELEKLIGDEIAEQNDIGASIHCKHIHDIIEWYCIDELSKYKYLTYNIGDYDLGQGEDEYNSICLEQFEELNSNTNFVMIQKICEESSVPYKSFFIDLLYSYNKPDKGRSKVYYIKDPKELICHAILYCFKDNQLPIKQCKYCKKYYSRVQNSQAVCLSCKGLSSPMTDEEQKAIFGNNIEGKLTRVYKKLCYSTVNGKHVLNYNKYTYDKDNDATRLSDLQSRILIDSFAELIRKYKRMGYEYIEKYKTLSDPIVQKDYATFVREWLQRIDEYYNFKRIIELIKQAQDTNPDKPMIIIKEFSLSGAQVEEIENYISLYKQD